MLMSLTKKVLSLDNIPVANAEIPEFLEMSIIYFPYLTQNCLNS